MHRTRRLRLLTVVLATTLAVVAMACSSEATSDGSGPSTTADAPTGGEAASTSAASDATDWEQVLAPPSCRCSDDTPFHYWVRRADPDKVLFFLSGGGACFSAETCSIAGATYNVNLDEDAAPDADGIFDLDDPANPLADYSMVVVPYCTGDLHLGTTAHDYGDGVVVRHTGYINASTALGAAAALFPEATDVVVAGSSAGSAGAPLYGGAAHDVWPDADIAVVADSSAAYPGTPEITLAIGSLWGTSALIPPWPETKDLPPEAWSLPGLFVNSSSHDPEIRFATYNSAFDDVQADFSSKIGVDPSNLVGLIDANNAEIRAKGVDLVNWVAPGTEHTILGSKELYRLEDGDTQFVDWLAAFIAGDPVEDVHCVDCQPPA